MAADLEMSVDDLPEYLQAAGTNYVIRARATYNHGREAPVVYEIYLGNLSRLGDRGPLETWHDQQIKGSSLFFLLHMFKHQLCEVPRDRIFSLLALCKDGPSIHVDYASSNEELAEKILTELPETFCVCAIHIVGRLLSYQQPPHPDGEGAVALNHSAYVRIKVHQCPVLVVGSLEPPRLRRVLMDTHCGCKIAQSSRVPDGTYRDHEYDASTYNCGENLRSKFPWHRFPGVRSVT
jgi:hypothetical protein